jgi:sulfur-carrier protein
MLESPVVAIHIPRALRTYTSGHDEVIASGETVGEVLESLDHVYPGIRSQLVSTDGRLSSAFDVYLGGLRARCLQGLATPVGPEDLLSIVPAPDR